MKPPTRQILFLLLPALFSFAYYSCKDGGVDPLPTGPDTTSHEFNWQMFFLNEGPGLFDVAIINDTLAYAVGDLGSYNMAMWNGKKWTLNRVTVNFRGNLITPPLNGIFAFSMNQIWLCGGLAIYGNGSTWMPHDVRLITGFDSLYLSRCWSEDPSQMYFVGLYGTLVSFSNGTWRRHEGGTTVDLRDVWGTPDGKTIWACGWSNDNSKSLLLEYDGQTWRTVWARDGASPVSPFGYYAATVWADQSLFLAGGREVFKVQQEATKVATLPWFPYRIRGSKENNIAVAGDGGMIWHYNGASWKELNQHPDRPLYSVAVSTNMIVAVGSDYSTFPNRALIYVGRRF